METQVGFRFHPTDDEIVNHYLWNKMVGRSDLTRAIAEIDVYGFEPRELPPLSRIQSGDLNWYFFCRQSKRSSGGWSRRTGQGSWKKTGQDRKIKDPDDSSSVIGTKKTLVFHNVRSGNRVRTGWVMHEYSPAPSAAPPDAMPYVVCRIKYKGDDKNEVLSSRGSSNNSAAANKALPEVPPQQNVESVNPQTEADFEMAVQVLLDHGLSIEDLSPLRSGSNSNEEWMQEGGISHEDLLQFEGDDNEPDAMQIQVDTIEQEDEFVYSLFADPDDQLSDQDFYDFHNDQAYAEDCHGTDAQPFNQLPRNSGMYNSPSGSKQEHERRLETAVKHDDILLMNPSGVDSTITTGFAVNPTGEGLSTPPGPRKPRNELRSNRVGAVADKSARIVPHGGFSSKTLPGVKATKSVDHGKSNVHIRADTSASKSCNKDQQMNKQTGIKSSSSSNSCGSASSDRKSSSSSSTVAVPKGEEFPPSVFILNVAVGLMIFVAIVLHAWPCSEY